MGSSSGLVFIRLLADRALQPLGVQFRVGAEGITSFEALLAADLIKTLSGQCALLLSPLDAASLPPELLAKSQLAGCQVMDDSVLHVRHDAGIPDLLPSTQWIDGNWFLQPPIKPKGAQAASRVMALKLVQLVSTDADTHEIEDVFRQDPTLSYHLLRLVNSLAFGAPRRISSFSQAILMLGRQQLKRWLNLILFASGSDDPRAPMLLGRVVVRARMMELLTRESGGDKAQQELAFMAGMFSLLGVLFGQPLEDVVKPLQLDETLQSAVLQHTGPIGQLLSLMEHAERMDAQAVSEDLAKRMLSAETFNLLMLESVAWMLGMRQESADD